MYTIIDCFCAEFTEQNNAIGYLKTGDIFTPLTNFTFKFVCRVSSPFESDDNTDYSGFIVEVKASGTDDKGLVIACMVTIKLL